MILTKHLVLIILCCTIEHYEGSFPPKTFYHLEVSVPRHRENEATSHWIWIEKEHLTLFVVQASLFYTSKGEIVGRIWTEVSSQTVCSSISLTNVSYNIHISMVQWLHQVFITNIFLVRCWWECVTKLPIIIREWLVFRRRMSVSVFLGKICSIPFPFYEFSDNVASFGWVTTT